MEKIKKGLRKSKGKLVVALVLYLVLLLIFIAPLSIAIKEAMKTGAFNISIFFDVIQSQIAKPFSSIGLALSAENIGLLWSTLWKFTLIYLLAMAVGIYKAMPKSEYDEIEHGSSDWSENGEQYKVLSKNKGILLAQKNYLPINKRGNVNVLVVGRIWIW